MPQGRMQHTEALPPMRSRPHEKIIFCRPSSGYQNCGTRSANLVWCFLKLADTILKPLLIICRVASFDGTDNLPIEFLGRAASNSMPQPSRCNIYIYLWHGATFAVRPCRTLPLCAARGIVWLYLNTGSSCAARFYPKILKLDYEKTAQKISNFTYNQNHFKIEPLLPH